MTLYTGEEFNDKFRNAIFLKLTNSIENHNGFQYQTGLNIDTVPFNPLGKCCAGGIYFCSLDKLPMWINYNKSDMVYARCVSIPISTSLSRDKCFQN